VNRNTAATFCGMVLVLSLGLLFHELMSRRWLVAGIAKGLDPGLPLLPALLAGAAAASFLSLLLTKSRAGVFFSLLIALLFLLVYWIRRIHLTGGWSIRNSLVGLGFFFSIVALIDLLGGRTLVRLEVSGIASARWCSYNSAMQAIQDHWLLGTGLGSFFDVFPMYKDIECGIFGEWEYLHNVYLEAAFSGGIVLLAISAYAVGVLAFYFARGIVRRQRYQFLPWTGLLILILVLLHSSLDFSIQINGIAVFTSAALAAAVAISNSRAAKTDGGIALSLEQSKSAAVSRKHGAMAQ
jgi:O-antigen ligase